MQVLPRILQTEQQQMSVMPAVRVYVGNYAFESGIGYTTCHNTRVENPQWDFSNESRLLGIPYHNLEPYTNKAELRFSNYDGLFSRVDFTGERCVILWGLEIGHERYYGKTPPMSVWAQEDTSSEGQLEFLLTTFGIPDALNKDKADGEWSPEDDDTIKDILEKILGCTADCYADCVVYNIEWGNPDLPNSGLDMLIDTIYLGSSFKVKDKETRLSAISRLLGYTYCVMLPSTADPDVNGLDSVHIFNPVISGSTYHAQIALDGHQFYTRSRALSITRPNWIVVKTPDNADESYSGYAKDGATLSKSPQNKEVYTEKIAGVTSDEQCADIAAAILTKIQKSKKGTGFYMPMHCGLEPYDYIRLDDMRDPNMTGLIGNVGVVRRKLSYDKRDNIEYTLSGGFGGWQHPTSLQDILSRLSGYVEPDGEPDVSVAANIQDFSAQAVNIGDGLSHQLCRFTLGTKRKVRVYKAGVCDVDGAEDEDLKVVLYDYTASESLYSTSSSRVAGSPLVSATGLGEHDIGIYINNGTGSAVNCQGFMSIEVANE